MKKCLLMLVAALSLTTCGRVKDGPFGLWKTMSRDDINACCQIEKTAMVARGASILKVIAVPKPDPLFEHYYVHFSRGTGVFGINASSPPMPINAGEAAYQKLVAEMAVKYGSPSQVTEKGETIWNYPASPWGIFRLTVSKGDHDGRRMLGIFYLFDNNQIYR